MITLPTPLQKTYVKRITRKVAHRSTLEVMSNHLVILLSMYFVCVATS